MKSRLLTQALLLVICVNQDTSWTTLEIDVLLSLRNLGSLIVRDIDGSTHVWSAMMGFI